MLICPCCNLHIREPTYDMEGAKCPKCGWSIYVNKNERIDIMPKLTLTNKEKVNLELYINFLVHNSNPCDSCGWRTKTVGCGRLSGCQQGNEYQKKLAKYDVADLLNYPEIEEYVTSYTKLIKCRAQVQSLTDDIYNLEKKINGIMNSIDLVKDSEKKIEDKTEFYCDNCKMLFKVPTDKCKIAFDGGGGFKANVRKYYICPKCTKFYLENNV